MGLESDNCLQTGKSGRGASGREKAPGESGEGKWITVAARCGGHAWGVRPHVAGGAHGAGALGPALPHDDPESDQCDQKSDEDPLIPDHAASLREAAPPWKPDTSFPTAAGRD